MILDTWHKRKVLTDHGDQILGEWESSNISEGLDVIWV